MQGSHRRTRLGITTILTILLVAILALRTEATSPSDHTAMEPRRIGHPSVVASGSSLGIDWTLFHTRTDDGEFCADLTVSGPGIGGVSDGGGCGFGVPAENEIAVTTDGFGLADTTFAYGPVSKAAKTVRLVFNDGHLIEVPTVVASSLAVDFFVAAIPGVTLLSSATALDASGNVVESVNMMGD